MTSLNRAGGAMGLVISNSLHSGDPSSAKGISTGSGEPAADEAVFVSAGAAAPADCGAGDACGAVADAGGVVAATVGDAGAVPVDACGVGFAATDATGAAGCSPHPRRRSVNPPRQLQIVVRQT